MARSILNTTLEFGLVSVPIAVMPIVAKQEVELDRGLPITNKKNQVTGYHALNQIEIDAITRDPRGDVAPVYGVFTEKPSKDERSTWGGFKPIPTETLTAIEAETKIDTFQITGFIPFTDIPFERAKGSYYIAPKQGMAKQLRLLYEALTTSGRAGILKIVIRKRQHPAVIYAKDGCLFMTTLSWGEDFAQAKQSETVIAGAEADPALVKMAVSLIDAMGVGVEALNCLSDDLRARKSQLLATALEGHAAATDDGSTVDLMASLRASVDATKAGKRPVGKRPVRAKAKAA